MILVLAGLALAGDVGAILLPNVIILSCFALVFSLVFSPVTLRRVTRNLEG